ncbi:hypothetical protein IGI80_002216 [Enterococcus sp. DIV1420a]
MYKYSLFTNAMLLIMLFIPTYSNQRYNDFFI